MTFASEGSQNYGIFYSENLLDFTLVETAAGTGSPVQVTATLPASPTDCRFWLVAPTALP